MIFHEIPGTNYLTRSKIHHISGYASDQYSSDTQHKQNILARPDSGPSFKNAKLQPIPKEGLKTQAFEYHLIAIVSVMSKIIEKIHDTQHGFRMLQIY